MKIAGIPDHPLFRTNALSFPTEEGEWGAYSFLVDAFIMPSADKNIRQHEIAHRALTHYGMTFSTFHVIRHLIGISHTLLSFMLEIAQKNGSLQGQQLDALAVVGKSPEAEGAIKELIRRVKYVETLIEMAWRGLSPIAELAAIDFAEGVEEFTGDWRIRRKTYQTTEEEKSANGMKEKLVEAVLSQYPADFGGYHVNFGSFQNALRQAWNAYNEIADDETRKELLRLCMSSFFLDEKNEIRVLDPIKIILDHALFAQKEPKLASEYLIEQRQFLEDRSKKLVDMVITQMLTDIPEALQYPRRFVDVLQVLIEKQLDWKHWGILPITSYTALGLGRQVNHSFLAFDLDMFEEITVLVNDIFLVGAFREDLPTKDLPQYWWMELLLLESIRQALITGSVLSCPFQGWKVLFRRTGAYQVCSDRCFIRQWLDLARWWTELPAEEATCDLTANQ